MTDMKKLSATIAACITFAGMAYGQFTLTPEGMKAESDTQAISVSEHIECDEPSAMFSATHDFLVSISHDSPHTVLTTYPDRIVFQTVGEIGLGGTFIYDVPKYIACYRYTIGIIFSDGEIRFELPQVSFPYMAAGQGVTKEVVLAGSRSRGRLNIFTKRGTLKEEEAKAQIEEQINGIVNRITDVCRTTVKE